MPSAARDADGRLTAAVPTLDAAAVALLENAEPPVPATVLPALLRTLFLQKFPGAAFLGLGYNVRLSCARTPQASRGGSLPCSESHKCSLLRPQRYSISSQRKKQLQVVLKRTRELASGSRDAEQARATLLCELRH